MTPRIALPRITEHMSLLMIRQQLRNEALVADLLASAPGSASRPQVNAGLTGERPAAVGVAPGTYLDLSV